jgi:hypothetical protein
MSRFQAVTIFGAAFILALVCGGCGGSDDEPIFSSVGSYGDVAVITSDAALYDAAVPFLNRLSPDVTFVIKKEETYRFQHFTGDAWKNGRNYRNIIFLVRLGDGGDVEKAVRKLVGQDNVDRLKSGNGDVLIVRDPYFGNQLAFIAASVDRNLLASVLNREGAALGDTLAADVNRRMIRDNRRSGINAEAVRRDWNRYGFHLEIPRIFKENQFEPDGFPGVEWLYSSPEGTADGLTYAWTEVDDPAAALADRDVLLALRGDMGETMHDASELNDLSLKWSEETVAGLAAVRLDGAWASRKASVGGPFRTYFFAVPDRGIVLAVDLLVYAPNREKMEDMRRLRAIVETLSFEPPGA